MNDKISFWSCLIHVIFIGVLLFGTRYMQWAAFILYFLIPGMNTSVHALYFLVFFSSFELVAGQHLSFFTLKPYQFFLLVLIWKERKPLYNDFRKFIKKHQYVTIVVIAFWISGFTFLINPSVMSPTHLNFQLMDIQSFESAIKKDPSRIIFHSSIRDTLQNCSQHVSYLYGIRKFSTLFYSSYILAQRSISERLNQIIDNESFPAIYFAAYGYHLHGTANSIFRSLLAKKILDHRGTPGKYFNKNRLHDIQRLNRAILMELFPKMIQKKYIPSLSKKIFIAFHYNGMILLLLVFSVVFIRIGNPRDLLMFFAAGEVINICIALLALANGVEPRHLPNFSRVYSQAQSLVIFLPFVISIFSKTPLLSLRILCFTAFSMGLVLLFCIHTKIHWIIFAGCMFLQFYFEMRHKKHLLLSLFLLLLFMTPVIIFFHDGYVWKSLQIGFQRTGPPFIERGIRWMDVFSNTHGLDWILGRGYLGRYWTQHNIYISLLVDRGIVGLAGYLLIIFFSFYRGLVFLHRDKKDSFRIASVMAVIAVILGGMTSDHFFVLANVWIAIALCASPRLLYEKG